MTPAEAAELSASTETRSNSTTGPPCDRAVSSGRFLSELKIAERIARAMGARLEHSRRELLVRQRGAQRLDTILGHEVLGVLHQWRQPGPLPPVATLRGARGTPGPSTDRAQPHQYSADLFADIADTAHYARASPLGGRRSR